MCDKFVLSCMPVWYAMQKIQARFAERFCKLARPFQASKAHEPHLFVCGTCTWLITVVLTCNEAEMTVPWWLWFTIACSLLGIKCGAVDNVLFMHHDAGMAGAPAAEASHPGEEEGDGELQAEAMSVPLRGQGGAATPLTDVGMLFAQNQSKLQALKVNGPALCFL